MGLTTTTTMVVTLATFGATPSGHEEIPTLLGFVQTLLGVVEGRRTHYPNKLQGKTTELTVQLASILFLVE